MNLQELSQLFDVKIGSYYQNLNFGRGESMLDYSFDEYEKSLFLTLALEKLVIELYQGKEVGTQTSFEGSELLRRYLANLVKTTKIEIPDYNDPLPIVPNLSLRSLLTLKKLYSFTIHLNSPIIHIGSIGTSANPLFITYEALFLKSDNDDCINGKLIEVVPVTQDEYHRIKENPFRMANKNRAFRLDVADSVDSKRQSLEIITSYPLNEIDYYVMRYVEHPKPILLIPLKGGSGWYETEPSIENEINQSEPSLPEELHGLLIDRAVYLAIQSRAISSSAVKQTQ